jgi:HSP20 family protein
MTLALWDPWYSRSRGSSLFETPKTDDYISETDSAFSIEVEMPGMKTEDVVIETKNGLLFIKAEHKNERRERRFKRTYRLPETVNDEAIEATLADGILTVTLPKREAPSSRKIAIRAN